MEMPRGKRPGTEHMTWPTACSWVTRLPLSPPINWCGYKHGTQGPQPLARRHFALSPICDPLKPPMLPIPLQLTRPTPRRKGSPRGMWPATCPQAWPLSATQIRLPHCSWKSSLSLLKDYQENRFWNLCSCKILQQPVCLYVQKLKYTSQCIIN